MRTVLLVTALLALGTASSASLPTLPTCGQPGLEAICINLFTTDETIGDGHPRQEASFENGTYAMQATMTVDAGGVFVIFQANVVLGDVPQPIIVHPGGTVVIYDSDITGIPDTSPSVIVAQDGSTLRVSLGRFSGAELRVETDDATIEDSDFTRGNPALRLAGFDGTLTEDNTFHDNTVGINVTGGTPTIERADFLRDRLGIELYATHVNLADIDMVSVANGIHAVQSQGTFTNMRLSDDALPPDVGINMQDTSGGIRLSNSQISSFGVGIRCTNANYIDEGDNTFTDNLQDNDGC